MLTITPEELAQAREITYHVFTNKTDLWTDVYSEALIAYRNFKQEHGCARLYIELYHDRENDVMIREDCLRSFGPYPS